MGANWARVHTWDGSKWNFTSDWYQADEQIIKPMVKAAADKYAAEKKLSAARPRTASPDPPAPLRPPLRGGEAEREGSSAPPAPASGVRAPMGPSSKRRARCFDPFCHT
jgi:hypothetical protein